MKRRTPKSRAKALKKILAATYDDGQGATKANITDMLTDLRHLCDAEGLSFAECDRAAYRHYGPEVLKKTIAEA